MDVTVLRGIISTLTFSCTLLCAALPLYPGLVSRAPWSHGCFVGSLCELQGESFYIPEGNDLQVKPPHGLKPFHSLCVLSNNSLAPELI
ncbi:hypothetical protein FKM82_029339 [Ascaphus truei]